VEADVITAECGMNDTDLVAAIEALANALSTQTRCRIEGHRLEWFGLCRECRTRA
jgi:Fe2+ or Zn2+ uptake regulation protein